MTDLEPPREIRNPPTTLLSAVRFLGPGFILSAAIVGSGELIATTALGARAGFLLLWVIIFSCFVKVAIQLQYGRHCIGWGRPSLQAWNATVGPRIFSVHWSIYIGFLFILASFVGAGGIIGGAAQVLVYVAPQVRIELWVVMIAFLLGLLVFHGKYEPVEKLATFFNLVFVSSILYCIFATLRTRYAFNLHDLASGFTFKLPPEGLALAVAVFGITGIAGGEIVMYPYWCIEKGYAAWAGSRDDSPGWAMRARGWIRVMQLDAVISLLVYTLATCGFYLLGASVLRPQGNLADGNGLIVQLSGIFTGVLGERSKIVYMVCAFTVLFSTLFSNTAGFSRLWTDLLGIYRLINTDNPRDRRVAVAVLSWALPSVWGAVFLTVRRPLFLVVFMGIANSLFLLVVAYQAFVFRYKHTDRRLVPSRAFDVALWLSVLAVVFVAGKVLQSAFG
jgi:Mn2+/Fe2+ NRAMP family transporter